MRVSMNESAVPRVTPPGSGGEAATTIVPRLPGDPRSPFAETLDRLGRDLDRRGAELGALVRSLGSGAQLGMAKLIALQADVYRYSEAVEVSSRLVDRATGGIKTVLQGGGQ